MNFNNIDLLLWLPWLNFYSEDILLQFSWGVLLSFFISSGSLYYGILYLIGIVFLWGVILAEYNLEVLTGFLFVVELTAVLVLILFLLALNFEGRVSTVNQMRITPWLLLLWVYGVLCYFYTSPHDFKVLNALAYWDSYYNANVDKITNDLAGLFLCYYYMHSVLFIIFAFLIFFATLVCVQLAALAKLRSQQSLAPLRDLFNLTLDLVSFDFKRKQSSTQQNRRHAFTRFVRSGKLNVTKE